MNDLVEITVLIISSSIYDIIRLQELVIFVGFDGWAERNIFGEAFDEQIQEGFEVRI
jgi:hypothetical protein